MRLVYDPNCRDVQISEAWFRLLELLAAHPIARVTERSLSAEE